MTKIKKLLDYNGEVKYPLTHERAVRDNNGVTLESKLQSIDASINKVVKDVSTDLSQTKASIEASVSGITAECINQVNAVKDEIERDMGALEQSVDSSMEYLDQNIQVYNVSQFHTHHTTDVWVTTRTATYEGDHTSDFDQTTPVSDSSTVVYTRTETTGDSSSDTTDTEEPEASYDSEANITTVTWVTTRTKIGDVNNFTLDEAIARVPLSYQHGGLILTFISNRTGKYEKWINKYKQWTNTKSYWYVNDWDLLDLTAYTFDTKYNNITTALTALNNLPTEYKKGSMGVKFVQTSDNKYVRYNLMSTSWSNNVANWHGITNDLTKDSNDTVTSSGIYKQAVETYNLDTLVPLSNGIHYSITGNLTAYRLRILSPATSSGNFTITIGTEIYNIPVINGDTISEIVNKIINGVTDDKYDTETTSLDNTLVFRSKIKGETTTIVCSNNSTGIGFELDNTIIGTVNAMPAIGLVVSSPAKVGIHMTFLNTESVLEDWQYIGGSLVVTSSWRKCWGIDDIVENEQCFATSNAVHNSNVTLESRINNTISSSITSESSKLCNQDYLESETLFKFSDFCNSDSYWKEYEGTVKRFNASSHSNSFNRTDLIPITEDIRQYGFIVINAHCHLSANIHALYWTDTGLKVVGTNDGSITSGEVTNIELNIIPSSIPSNAMYFVVNGGKSGSYISNSPSRLHNISKTKDIYYKSPILQLTQNKAIINSVVSESSSSWYLTDKIYITEEMRASTFLIHNVHKAGSNTYPFGMFFDSSDVSIKNVTPRVDGAETADVYVVDFPAEAVYMRFNVLSTNKNDVYYEYWTSLHKENELKNDVYQYQELELTNAQAIHNGNVQTTDITTTWYLSNKVYITKEMRSCIIIVHNVRSVGDGAYPFGMFFKSDDTPICDVFPSENITVKDIIINGIPSDASYMRFNGSVVEPHIYIEYWTKFHEIELPSKIDLVDKQITLPNNPLEVIRRDPGFTSIFRKWSFIGNSLSSGTHNCDSSQGTATETAIRDVSWCNFMMRATGANGNLYTKPGVTAAEWLSLDVSGENKGWLAMYNDATSPNPFIATSYAIELGSNDASKISAGKMTLGAINDIQNDYDASTNNSFYAAYAQIIKNIRSISPIAPIFCITYMGVANKSLYWSNVNDAIREIVNTYKNATTPDVNIWLVDMYKYMPRTNKDVSGDTLYNRYANRNHWTSLGYLWFSWAFMTYIDWIVRNNLESFKGQALIGTDYHI